MTEKAVVLVDYNAAPDSDFVSVHRGQQVEVLETHYVGKPEYSLIRLPAQCGPESPVEGLVPLAALRISNPTSAAKTGGAATSLPVSPDVECEESCSTASKKRGFNGYAPTLVDWVVGLRRVNAHTIDCVFQVVTNVAA